MHASFMPPPPPRLNCTTCSTSRGLVYGGVAPPLPRSLPSETRCYLAVRMPPIGRCYLAVCVLHLGDAERRYWYDFLDIYEAPDVKSGAKLSMISQANGALQAESLPAIPYKDLLELVKEV